MASKEIRRVALEAFNASPSLGFQQGFDAAVEAIEPLICQQVLDEVLQGIGETWQECLRDPSTDWKAALWDRLSPGEPLGDAFAALSQRVALTDPPETQGGDASGAAGRLGPQRRVG